MVMYMSKKQILYILFYFLTTIVAFTTTKTKICTNTKSVLNSYNPLRSFESDYGRRSSYDDRHYDRSIPGDYYSLARFPTQSFGNNYYPEDNLSRRYGDMNSRRTAGNNRFNSRTNTGMIRSEPSSLREFDRRLEPIDGSRMPRDDYYNRNAIVPLRNENAYYDNDKYYNSYNNGAYPVNRGGDIDYYEDRNPYSPYNQRRSSNEYYSHQYRSPSYVRDLERRVDEVQMRKNSSYNRFSSDRLNSGYVDRNRRMDPAYSRTDRTRRMTNEYRTADRTPYIGSEYIDNEDLSQRRDTNTGTRSGYLDERYVRDLEAKISAIESRMDPKYYNRRNTDNNASYGRNNNYNNNYGSSYGSSYGGNYHRER